MNSDYKCNWSLGLTNYRGGGDLGRACIGMLARPRSVKRWPVTPHCTMSQPESFATQLTLTWFLMQELKRGTIFNFNLEIPH